MAPGNSAPAGRAPAGAQSTPDEIIRQNGGDPAAVRALLARSRAPEARAIEQALAGDPTAMVNMMVTRLRASGVESGKTKIALEDRGAQDAIARQADELQKQLEAQKNAGGFDLFKVIIAAVTIAVGALASVVTGGSALAVVVAVLVAVIGPVMDELAAKGVLGQDAADIIKAVAQAIGTIVTLGGNTVGAVLQAAGSAVSIVAGNFGDDIVKEILAKNPGMDPTIAAVALAVIQLVGSLVSSAGGIHNASAGGGQLLKSGSDVFGDLAKEFGEGTKIAEAIVGGGLGIAGGTGTIVQGAYRHDGAMAGARAEESKIVAETKQEKMMEETEGFVASQRDFDKLEKKARELSKTASDTTLIAARWSSRA